MTIIRKCVQVFGTLGAAIGVVAADFASKHLSFPRLPLGLTLTFTLLIVATSLIVFQEGARLLLTRPTWARRRILGAKYVEGSWIDSVYIGNTLIGVALIQIEPSEEDLRLSGELWSPAGFPIGAIHTDMVVTEWPVIKYKYIARRSGNRYPPTSGYAELVFDEQTKPSVRFSGYYIDHLRFYRCDVYGRRLQDNERANLATTIGRSEMVKSYVIEETTIHPGILIAGEYPEMYPPLLEGEPRIGAITSALPYRQFAETDRQGTHEDDQK